MAKKKPAKIDIVVLELLEIDIHSDSENTQTDIQTFTLPEDLADEIIGEMVFGCCEQFEGSEDGFVAGIHLFNVKKAYKIIRNGDAVSYYITNPINKLKEAAKLAKVKEVHES